MFITFPYTGDRIMKGNAPTLSVMDLTFGQFETQLKSESSHEGVIYKPWTTEERRKPTEYLNDDTVRLVEEVVVSAEGKSTEQFFQKSPNLENTQSFSPKCSLGP